MYLLDEAFRSGDDPTGLSSLLVQARAWANNVVSSIGDNIWTQEFAAALKALGPAVSAEERAAMFELFERADAATRKGHLHRIKALARMRTGHAPKLAPAPRLI